jgi:hypothetical protein
MTDDDKNDLKLAVEALEGAIKGVDDGDHERFMWGIGFALGRITRVRNRFYPARKSDSIECPHCHWGFPPSVIGQHLREKHSGLSDWREAKR